MSSSLSPGTKLGRYEIRSQLGAGGMGEVYLAQDTELDRKVAVKILPADSATVAKVKLSRDLAAEALTDWVGWKALTVLKS